MNEIPNMQDCPKDGASCTTNPPEPFVKLWSLTYRVSGEPNYAGMAVVAALDSAEAEQIFKTKCMHNGKQDKIKVGRIDQIPYPIVPALIMENYVKVFD